MNPVLELIHQLVSDGYHPMAVGAETSDGRSWAISVTLQEWTAADGRQTTIGGKYAVSIDMKGIPEEVQATISMRVPDATMQLAGSAEEIYTIIDEVRRVGQALDIARFERPDGSVRILTKPNVWLHPDSYAFKSWIDKKH